VHGLQVTLSLLVLVVVGMLVASCEASPSSATSASPSLLPNATISAYLLDLESQQPAFVTDAWMLQKTLGTNLYYATTENWTSADAATAAAETAKIEALRSDWRERWPTVPTGCTQLDKDWRKAMDDVVQAGLHLVQEKPSSWRTQAFEQFDASGSEFHQVVGEEPHVMLEIPSVAQGVTALGRALHEMAEASVADPSGLAFLAAVSIASKDYAAAVRLLKGGPCPLDLVTPARTPLRYFVAMSKAAKAHDVAALHQDALKARTSLLKAQGLFGATWAS
jgi:hypothetical protein